MSRKRRSPRVPAAAAYAPVLNTALQATTASVQQMHEAIAGTTFDSLQRVPGLSVPTRIVQGVHDAISQGVYAAVRHGGHAALTLAGGAERLATDPSRPVSRKALRVRSALNGVMGDALATAGNPLAVRMGLFADGVAMDWSPSALATLPSRVSIFVHGLACDEHSWQRRVGAWATSSWATHLPDGRQPDYGSLLQHELGIRPLYLRYNTGLAIEASARQFAEMAGQLVAGAPQVREWVLIGHSMGGLVARAALEIAQAEDQAWATRVPMLVCLGSPHQGAPLERLGHLTSKALELTETTRPLARIANSRSQGIKDLRHGLKARRGRVASAAPLALRLVSGTLGDEGGSAMSSLIGSLLGDGLVTPTSAADAGLTGDVQRVELRGFSHMALLNHPRVYAVLREWLGAAAPA